MAYEINYDDKRFAQVEADKKAALTDVEETYGGMINESDKYYQDQIDATVEWGDKQTQLQQEQTDFAIEKIEQQKAQTEKDYHKEQSAAYVDYQKQIDPYGVNAEQMAASGLKGSGYSESSKVAMYTAYQNRVAIAKESFNQAKLEYENMMTEARLQNNAAVAEIAYTTLQTKLQLALEGFQYKNSLLIEQANQKTNVENTYYARWQDVLDQINTENALEEEMRQFNKSNELQWAQLEEEKRQFDKELESQQALIDKGDSSVENVINRAEAIGSGQIYGQSTIDVNSATVDMDSVLSLGYGPISAKKLDELISSGEVIEYEENGKLKYKKVNKPTLKF